MSITAPVGLDAAQRSTLERLVIRARSLLESDLGAQAEGRFGIHLDGTIEDEAALPDDTTDKITRRDLEQIVTHLRTLGEDAPGAVARLLREAAFTHLNRLVAIRIAEAIGLLPESLAAGRRSQGFRDLGEIMPMLASDYRTYIQLCGDELAADAPALFDPRNPLLGLEPSTAAFDDLVDLVADPGAAAIWLAPDTLGWAYQFFNTGDERREMREASAPRNSRELAVRNQFFTPRYVVDFLVQNTIGRRLIENDPTSTLLTELPLLVDPPTEPGPSLDLDKVKCLDPACGSGHFLLGCYDVLERAWELAGVPPSESAPRIVSSLWGVDIDARCAQVASAAIVLRARRHCRNLPLPRPNIVTARGLPGGSAALAPDLQLTAGQRTLIDRVSDVLAEAPLLGVLLRAEDALDQEIRHGAFGGKPGTLELTDEAAEASERELLSHLQAIADQASSSVVERLLAAEADDALRLVEVVRQRYDAVLMNPPFGEPVATTKPYLRAAYAWLPTKDSNLLAAFVGRGLELCEPTGYLGAITSRAGLFLSTFENWRRAVMLDNRLVVLADLGFGVMEQAMVEAAAYVVAPRGASPAETGTFIRLLRDVDRAAALAAVATANRTGTPDNRLFRVPVLDFDRIPGAPIAYWLAPPLRRLFTDLPSLEGATTKIKVGLSTGDDPRFVRAFWEVDPARVARTAAETRSGRRWAPFAKGGEYAPYWSDIHLVVDYESEGERIRSHPGSAIRNAGSYFDSGLTWPRRTNSAMSVRVLPAGCALGDKGPAAFADDPLLTLAWLNSRLVRLLIDSTAASADETQTGGVPSRSYEVGIVKALPSPVGIVPDGDEVATRAMDVACAVAAGDHADETTRRFVAPEVLGEKGSLQERLVGAERGRLERIKQALAAYTWIDEKISAGVDPTGAVREALDEAAGPLVWNFSSEPLSDAEQSSVARLLASPMSDLIEAATASVGMARYVRLQHQVIDRRIETAALATRRSPLVLIDFALEHGLLAPDQPRSCTGRLLSYLVGTAFGRWDIRLGLDPSAGLPQSGLFDQVPICSPAMLVGPHGFPAAGGPAGYPLSLPTAGVLLDEPGHAWDIEAAIVRAAAVLFDDPTALLEDALEIVGRTTVRNYLRKGFFKDHLSQYSKSRRKAPLYWSLTVPSGGWGVWVYAPTFKRATLYTVASEAGRRERLAGEASVRLRRERQQDEGGRSAGKVTEEIDAEEKLAEELRRFRAEAERVAGLGWEPDLDDGTVLCAAPLADLFPSWPEAKTARTDLRKGKYEWATVAAWADQL